MRTTKKILGLLLPMVTVLFFISCDTNDDGPPPAENTLAELIAASANHSTLEAALERADLTDELQAPASITIFAPTDVAFATFLADAGFSSIEDVPEDVLQQILLNHVIGARVDESILRALGKNYLETLADGPGTDTNLALYFDATTATIKFNGQSNLTESDIAATNGVLHVVNAVIDRPTLATFVQSNDAFSELTTALTTATPGTNFMNTLGGTTTYTLFAPPDVAFEALLDSNPDWDNVSDIEEEDLTAILQHHLVSGNLRSTDISNNETVASLEGDLLTFSTANGNVEITDGDGNSGVVVVFANIQALNGVLHAIEAVLIPDTSN